MGSLAPEVEEASFGPPRALDEEEASEVREGRHVVIELSSKRLAPRSSSFWLGNQMKINWNEIGTLEKRFVEAVVVILARSLRRK